MTDSELRQLQMFPEVWYADITNQSNNEKRQLIVLAGKNGMNQGFTGLRAFLPSEQYWVFEWFWNVCLIQLLTTVLVRRNRVIITDGDPNLYEPLRLAQSKEISPWYNSDHKLCQFHLLAQPWQLHIVSLAEKNSRKIKILGNIYKWCSSWFYTIESEEEFQMSIKELFIYIRSSDVLFCSDTPSTVPAVSIAAIQNQFNVSNMKLLT